MKNLVMSIMFYIVGFLTGHVVANIQSKPMTPKEMIKAQLECAPSKLEHVASGREFRCANGLTGKLEVVE